VRILVTGAAGGLARAFLGHAGPSHDLEPLSHEQLDVADHDAVARAVARLSPEVIVNCAAFTRVDACEESPELAYRSNTTGPHNLALAARRVGAVLLHVSTDYVFDGLKGTAYDELDRPNPISVYGRSKLGGEDMVREVLPEHFVVRTGFVFGSGKDYLSLQVDRLQRGEPAAALGDRVGTPTYVQHLAERLLPLVETGRFGTYHLAGPEPATWFDLLARVRFLVGLPVPVERQEASELHLPAPRPRYSALTSVLLPELPIDPMPPLDVALKEFLDGHGH
jgi:dTDP-4-dehydrorhamnose reductase